MTTVEESVQGVSGAGVRGTWEGMLERLPASAFRKEPCCWGRGRCLTSECFGYRTSICEIACLQHAPLLLQAAVERSEYAYQTLTRSIQPTRLPP